MAWTLEVVRPIELAEFRDAREVVHSHFADEGIFACGSSGANVVMALRSGERLGEVKTVATLAVDSGMRHLSTEVFRHPSAKR